MENTIIALELKSQLDQLRPLNKEQESRIMQKFRLDWNYHSNHLEGNSLTYGETKALILFGITAQGKPLKDTLEITGHNEAINWVLEMVQGDRPLTENFIREMHSLLLKDSYKESKSIDGKIVPRKISSGKYKTTANHVETATGEIFYFATPEETPAKMNDLLVWYNEKITEVDKNPILIAAEFHYRFIRIHPFDDGNGRTARILMNFVLMKFGYPPVIIKTEDKTNYFAVLQMADAGNLEAFLEYIAQNLVRSLEIMIAGANGENIEEDDDLDKEIALLEQRLNNVQIIKEKMKTDYLSDLFKISFINLLNKFEFQMKKFEKMYTKSHFNFEFDGKIYYNLNDFDIEKINKTATRNNLDINYKYLGFKKEEFENIFFGSQISVIFFKHIYIIESSGDNKLEKPYGIKLSDVEIDKIVKSEVKRHKEFIEQKIAEKENI